MTAFLQSRHGRPVHLPVRVDVAVPLGDGMHSTHRPLCMADRYSDHGWQLVRPGELGVDFPWVCSSCRRRAERLAVAASDADMQAGQHAVDGWQERLTEIAEQMDKSLAVGGTPDPEGATQR